MARRLKSAARFVESVGERFETVEGTPPPPLFGWRTLFTTDVTRRTNSGLFAEAVTVCVCCGTGGCVPLTWPVDGVSLALEVSGSSGLASNIRWKQGINIVEFGNNGICGGPAFFDCARKPFSWTFGGGYFRGATFFFIGIAPGIVSGTLEVQSFEEL